MKLFVGLSVGEIAYNGTIFIFANNCIIPTSKRYTCTIHSNPESFTLIAVLWEDLKTFLQGFSYFRFFHRRYWTNCRNLICCSLSVTEVQELKPIWPSSMYKKHILVLLKVNYFVLIISAWESH